MVSIAVNSDGEIDVSRSRKFGRVPRRVRSTGGRSEGASM